jgi:hypothetical protein
VTGSGEKALQEVGHSRRLGRRELHRPTDKASLSWPDVWQSVHLPTATVSEMREIRGIKDWSIF